MRRSIYALSAKQLAKDICRLLTMHRHGDLNEAIVRQVLKGACWWVANAQGRKDACDCWSKAARLVRNAANGWDGLGLIHEHIFPRKVIQEAIFTLVEPTEARIEELLLLSRVCVVTAGEDERLRAAGLTSSLPDGAALQIEDLMKRYDAVGIEFAD